MPYEIFYPNENTDDGNVYGMTLYDDDLLYLGNDAGSNDVYIRFVNVTIPNDATILNAFIRLTAENTKTDTVCNGLIYFNDIGDAVAPVDYADYLALELTIETASWANIQPVSGNLQYDTVDIKEPLQSVISRFDWYSNGAIMAIIKDDLSTANAFRVFRSFNNNDSLYRPELHVFYDDGLDIELYDENDLKKVTDMLFPMESGKVSSPREFHLWNNKSSGRLNKASNLKVSLSNATKTFSGGTVREGQEVVDEQWTEVKSNGVTGAGIIDDAQIAFQPVGGQFSNPANYNALGDMPPGTARHLFVQERVPLEIDTGEKASCYIVVDYDSIPLDSFDKYFDITIPASYLTENLANIPIPLRFSASSGVTSTDLSQIYTDLGSNFRKIAITYDDHITQVPVENTSWDSVTNIGTCYIDPAMMHVNKDMTFRCYFGASAPDNPFVKTAAESPGVFSNNFIGAWNMAEDPRGNPVQGIKDSSGNGHHATPFDFLSGLPTQYLVPGLFGNCIDMYATGGGNYSCLFTYASQAFFLGTDDFTLTCVFNMARNDLIMNLLAQYDGGVNDNQYAVLNLGGGGNFQANFFNDSVATYPLGGTIGTFGTNTWYVMDITRQNNEWKLFVNNSLVTTGNSDVSINLATGLYIGAYYLTGLPSQVAIQSFDGKMNLMWLQREYRSQVWRTLIYEGLNDNLVTYGPITSR